MYGRPYLNTTTKARRFLSLFKINSGTMEFDPPPPPPGNLEASALHSWRFLYSDEGLDDIDRLRSGLPIHLG